MKYSYYSYSGITELPSLSLTTLVPGWTAFALIICACGSPGWVGIVIALAGIGATILWFICKSPGKVILAHDPISDPYDAKCVYRVRCYKFADTNYYEPFIIPKGRLRLVSIDFPSQAEVVELIIRTSIRHLLIDGVGHLYGFSKFVAGNPSYKMTMAQSLMLSPTNTTKLCSKAVTISKAPTTLHQNDDKTLRIPHAIDYRCMRNFN